MPNRKYIEIMNRLIEYRVWDVEGKRWLPSWQIHIEGDGSIHKHVGGDEYHEVREEFYTIQQFTGLLDIDGNKIFEGDIVEAVSSDNKYLSNVKWDQNDGRWGFISIKTKSMTFHYDLGYGCSKWRVVGNILENPELVNSKQLTGL